MKRALCIVALVALLPAVAWGQSATLAPGARVRVTSPDDNLKRHVSTVTEVKGDSIVMAGPSGSRTIALANVTALDVSMGRRNNVSRYALIGLGVGALVGVASVSAAQDDCESELGGCILFADESGIEAAAVVVVSALGVVAGAIVGAAHRTERWQKHPGIRANIAPSASGGITVSLSRAFR